MQTSEKISMNNYEEKKQKIEELLQSEYIKKGFLTEDDIIDVCIEYDLDLIEIDNLCDKLLNQKMIVKDAEIKKDNKDPESFVDRSQLDYDAILEKIKDDYPESFVIINSIQDILPPQPKEWQNLIKQAQNGNQYAKDRIVKMYLRTVMKQAYNFAKDNYCDFEEAFQNGVIGLIIAIQKYDSTSPDAFPSYFPLWVRQNMQRESTFRGTVIRYPSHFKDSLNIIVSAACNYIENDDFEEALLYVENDIVKKSLLSKNDIVSFIMPYIEMSENENMSYDDIEDYFRSSLNEYIDKILNNLSEREKLVLELRYGLNGEKIHTLEELGTILNVTRERVRQIEVKSLKKMKNYSRLYCLEDYLN